MISQGDNFYQTAFDITKEFIQTITVIDDKAGFETNSEFDAAQIIKIFAEHEKICSVYKFSEKEDVAKIVRVSQKSDVTILDWRLNIKPLYGKLEIQDLKDENENELEEDDSANNRGYYALEILKKVISDLNNKLKLFIIYTDEQDFKDISNKIENTLSEVGVSTKREEAYSLICNSCKVTICGKETLKNNQHLQEIKERAFSYDELCNFVIYDEFTRFTHGVVAGLFLKSIAALRTNTFSLLETFNRDIDPAFLTHKALLPNPDDAHEQILELIGSEIKSIINGTIDVNILHLLINGYIDTLNETFLNLHELKPHNCTSNQKPYHFSREEFKSVFTNGVREYTSTNKTIKKSSDELPRVLIKSTDSSFTEEQVKKMANDSNKKFAKLTTIKKKYIGCKNIPFLELGVILKTKSIGGEEEYWICIQPKCDSIRIDHTENVSMGRRFLFLKLFIQETEDKGHIISDTDSLLQIKFKITESKQFIFKPANGHSVIYGLGYENHWYFLDTFGLRFDYVCELKNDFAQSIAHDFGEQLSRVAINHSEWLRLKT
ncbi:response regulator receiver domain [Phocaeicola sp.]